MSIPATPPLDRFGATAEAAAVNACAQFKRFFRTTMQRASERTGRTEWRVPSPYAGDRMINLRMRPTSSDGPDALALQLVAWCLVDAFTLQDEARRVAYGQPRGMDARSTFDVDPNAESPALAEARQIAGLTGLEVVVILAVIAALVALAAMLIPPLMDLAGYLVMREDYVELEKAGRDAVQTDTLDWSFTAPGVASVGVGTSSKPKITGGSAADKTGRDPKTPPPDERDVTKPPGPPPVLIAGAAGVGALALGVAAAPALLVGGAGFAAAAAYRARAIKKKRDEVLDDG